MDLILAIGGRKSSNTARLAEVGQLMGVSFLITSSGPTRSRTHGSPTRALSASRRALRLDDVIQEAVDVLVAHGYAPPEGGIRPVDSTMPAY